MDLTNNDAFTEGLPAFVKCVAICMDYTRKDIEKLFKKNRKNTIKIGLLTLASGLVFLWHEHRMQAAEARIDRLTREVEKLLEECTKAKLGEDTEGGD